MAGSGPPRTRAPPGPPAPLTRSPRLQNPLGDVPEESRLLSLLANVLEALVDATEQREQARLQARLEVGHARSQQRLAGAGRACRPAPG